MLNGNWGNASYRLPKIHNLWLQWIVLYWNKTLTPATLCILVCLHVYKHFCMLLINTGKSINSLIVGAEPTINDKSVNMKACVTSGYQANCSCSREIDIQIRNCTTFFVYNLTATPTCPERFCFGKTNFAKSVLILTRIWIE